MRIILALLASISAVAASLILSAPVWILLVPVLLRQTGTERLVGLAALGLGVDLISAHPPLLVLMLPLLHLPMRRIERAVDRNIPFFFAVIFTASLLVLLTLVLSRLLVAGAQLIPLSVPPLLMSVYSPWLLGALLLVSLAAVLYESVTPSSPERMLTYA